MKKSLHWRLQKKSIIKKISFLNRIRYMCFPTNHPVVATMDINISINKLKVLNVFSAYQSFSVMNFEILLHIFIIVVVFPISHNEKIIYLLLGSLSNLLIYCQHLESVWDIIVTKLSLLNKWIDIYWTIFALSLMNNFTVNNHFKVRICTLKHLSLYWKVTLSLTHVTWESINERRQYFQ